MVQHVSKVKNIAARLEAVNERQSEAAIVSRIISTLPERFSAFVSAWKMQREADKTLVNLTARLSEEEMSHGQRERTEAFLANKARLPKKKENRGRSASNNRGKCFGCGSSDHFKRDCPKVKKNKGQPPKTKNQSQSAKDESDATAWTSVKIGAEAFTSNIEGNWVVDCGATHHMTPRQD